MKRQVRIPGLSNYFMMSIPWHGSFYISMHYFVITKHLYANLKAESDIL